ncbi:DUF1565 domain-containing protein [Aphelenchoides fujianensis]|nr:DUF1565 domain-containing protein [Aphelenchoides fujianensis]
MMKAACVLLLGLSAAVAFDTATYKVPDTNLAPPANALYVALNGKDTNAGTKAAPLRTPLAAVKKVANGGTIVVRAGVYYDVALGSPNKKFNLQAYPHEQVYFLGSVRVTAWTKEKTYWKAAFTNTLPNVTCPKEVISSAYPMACHPEQVFVNGAPLTQVAALSQVTAGKFFQPTGGKWVYIGTDPTSKVVEVTKVVRGLELLPGAAGSFIGGIGFAHYGCPWGDYSAAVISNAENVTISQCLFTQNSARGLSIDRPKQIVRSSIFSFNGVAGINGNRCHGTTISRCIFTRNNNLRFATRNCGAYCTIGAVKIAHAQNVRVDFNSFVDNFSVGLWFDLGCTDAIVTRNRIVGNQGSGVFYEVSARAIIASNILWKNTEYGVKLAGSDHVRIYNNDFAFSPKYQLGLLEDLRIACNKFDAYSCEMKLTWDTTNTIIRNNLFSNGQDLSFLVFGSAQVNAFQFIEAMDHNGWYRANSSIRPLVHWCNTTDKQWDQFKTHTDFMKARNMDWAPPGIGIRDIPTNPFFVNETAGNFNLTPNSVARSAGTPLRADIAAALGVPTSPVDVGALNWYGKA